MSNAWIEKLSEGPAINLNDPEALLDLADDLENCQNHPYGCGQAPPD